MEPDATTVAAEADKPIGFCVSIPKLVVMSLSTFGIYWILWGYKSFRTVPIGKNKALAAVEGLFLTVTLFEKQIEQESVTTNYPITFQKPLWSILFFVLAIFSRQPTMPMWGEVLVLVGMTLPLVVAQKKINELNAHVRSPVPISKMSILNWVIAVVGLALMALVLIYAPNET